MKNLYPSLKQCFLLLMLLFFAFQSCNKDENGEPSLPIAHDRGDIIKTTSQGTLSPDDIQQMLDATGTQLPFILNYSVEILSLNYYSIDGFGDQIIVSGAMFLPQGIDDLPMMSMQHGTETKRDLVASVFPGNSVERVIGLVTASMGYVTVVPDYPGFGVSNMMHPYLHEASLVPCVIDLMRACQSYSSKNQITLNGKLFLSGYSEGGYVTLLTQKVIEEKYFSEFNLTAVAPLAGPYDLKGMTDSIFKSGNYGTTAYIGYFLTAYDDLYGWNRLDDYFVAPYADKMPGLYDGSKTWGEIVNQLPASFSELMNPVYIADYLNGDEPDFTNAVQENTLLDWTPLTPIHFFHGDADDIVPYQNALTTIESFTARGADNIQLTTIPGGNHETSGPIAIVGAIQWFEGF